MFIKTLTIGNVEVSATQGEQEPEILREKALLNLCLTGTHTHPAIPMKQKLR